VLAAASQADDKEKLARITAARTGLQATHVRRRKKKKEKGLEKREGGKTELHTPECRVAAPRESQKKGLREGGTRPEKHREEKKGAAALKQRIIRARALSAGALPVPGNPWSSARHKEATVRAVFVGEMATGGPTKN